MATQVLTTDELTARLPIGWNYDQQKKEIAKEFDRGNFSGAVLFINTIASHAEAQDHHPDLYLHGYSKVRVTLATHSAGGVTEYDLKLAKTIDTI